MKLLIVDDHEIVRKGFKMMLEEEGCFETIEEADTIEQGLMKIQVYQPDMTIIDINLAGSNGLDIVEQAKQKGSKTKYIVFTSSSRKGDFERAKKLGVEGYILKDLAIEDILYAFRTIARGRQFYDTKMTKENKVSERDKILASLTQREKQIFFEIGKGLSNTEIAEKLYITENTVKKHVTSLMSKLQVKRRTEVALCVNKFWRRRSDSINL